MNNFVLPYKIETKIKIYYDYGTISKLVINIAITEIQTAVVLSQIAATREVVIWALTRSLVHYRIALILTAEIKNINNTSAKCV